SRSPTGTLGIVGTAVRTRGAGAFLSGRLQGRPASMPRGAAKGGGRCRITRRVHACTLDVPRLCGVGIAARCISESSGDRPTAGAAARQLGATVPHGSERERATSGNIPSASSAGAEGGPRLRPWSTTSFRTGATRRGSGMRPTGEPCAAGTMISQRRDTTAGSATRGSLSPWLMMRVKTQICVECGSSFSYEIKRGRSRRLCGDRRCYNARKLRQRLERRARYPRCKTEGCDKPAERIGAGLCEACYGRLRRTGSTAKRSPRYRYATRAGYVKLLIPGHPLADSNGLVMEHRKVMYDMLGPGPQTCF